MPRPGLTGSAAALPLVLLSSVGNVQRREDPAGCMFGAYLSKPIHQLPLFEIIADVLGQPPPRPTGIRPRSHWTGRWPGGHPLRILVAEDSIVNQKVVLAVLHRLGYRVDMVGNGLEVLSALARQSYDVILMDVHMPELDGFEATRRISQHWPRGRRPRIIGMTAAAMPGEIRQGADAGMDDYLIQPCSPHRLADALEQSTALAAGENAAPPPEAGVLQELLSQLDPPEVSAVAGSLLADTPRQLAALDAALARHDYPALATAAHTLKSTSAAAAPSARADLFDFLKPAAKTNSAGGSGLSIAPLSQDQMVSGLKEALAKGVQRSITNLGRDGGYLNNVNVKIPMPEKLRSVEKTLRSLGQGRLADDFVGTMNRAAEAAGVFSDAIKAMTLEDAKGLLKGPDDAATQYFKKTGEGRIQEKMAPIIKAATEKTGVTASYKKLMAQADPATSLLVGLGGGDAFDVDKYVSQKASDGLFKMVAEEEKSIRKNPAARTTDLLQKVFGAK